MLRGIGVEALSTVNVVSGWKSPESPEPWMGLGDSPAGLAVLGAMVVEATGGAMDSGRCFWCGRDFVIGICGEVVVVVPMQVV